MTNAITRISVIAKMSATRNVLSIIKISAAKRMIRNAPKTVNPITATKMEDVSMQLSAATLLALLIT